MMQRIGTAVIGIPVGLAFVHWGAWPFTIFVLSLAVVGLWEFSSALRMKEIELIKEIAFPCVLVALVVAYCWPGAIVHLWGALWFSVVFGSLMFHIFIRRGQEIGVPSGWRTASVGGTVLGTLYVGLFSFVILLRNLDTESVMVSGLGVELSLGARLLFLLLLATWTTDATAYFVGKLIGKHKIAPEVSPGKTWEGACSGFVGAVIVVALMGGWFKFDWRDAIFLSLIVGVAGQVGDLCKSVIKRDVGVKDFGVLIPGHGGVLDRFDSLLINTPLVYLYAQVALMA